jgi:Ca-activated chloride channel family protein
MQEAAMTPSVSRHRRSRRAGWVAVVAGLTLVAAAAVVVVLRTAGSGCGDPAVTLNVAASPDQYPVLRDLADRWNAGDPAVGDRCARVTVQALPPSLAAATLAPDWDEARDGQRPDVWVPDSSLWLAVAGGRPDAAAMLPDAPPSLASSPVVLGMQEPMAAALGWPEQQLGWSELLGAFAGGQTWEQFGHPEWGPLRLGVAEPTRSTAGLAGVLTVLDPDGDQQLSDQELLGGIAFTQLLTAYEPDTAALLQAYQGGAGAEAEPSELPAAFPVLERDLAAYAAEEPEVPLVPVYPSEGLVFADYPYAVLDAPWVDADRRRLAEDFLAHLRGPAGREAYAQAGFRDPEHTSAGAPLLAPQSGFQAEVAVPTRVPSEEALGELLGMWPVLLRPNNVLIVVDTSGSMNQSVPGTDQTRLGLLQSAATQGIGLLNNQTVVGLWEFSTELTPTTPYRELVPIGPAGEDLGAVLGEDFAGVDRLQAMIGAIQGLQARGGTGLYDTVQDAYLAMQQAWQPDAQNMLVVITDGRDEDHPGRSLPQLLSALEGAVQADRPLPVIALAVGPEADAAALEQVTEITGGRTVIARDVVSALQQVVLAFAGRIA